MVLPKYFPKEQTLERMKQMKPKDKVLPSSLLTAGNIEVYYQVINRTKTPPLPKTIFPIIFREESIITV